MSPSFMFLKIVEVIGLTRVGGHTKRRRGLGLRIARLRGIKLDAAGRTRAPIQFYGLVTVGTLELRLLVRQGHPLRRRLKRLPSAYVVP